MENVKNYLINLKENFEKENKHFYSFFERKYWIQREVFLNILKGRTTVKTIRKLKTCWIEWNKIFLDELDKKENEKIERKKRWAYKTQRKIYTAIDKFTLEKITEPNLDLKKDILEFRKKNPKLDKKLPTKSFTKILRDEKIGQMAVDSLLKLDFWCDKSIEKLKETKQKVENEKKEYDKNFYKENKWKYGKNKYIFTKPEKAKIKTYQEYLDDEKNRGKKRKKAIANNYDYEFNLKNKKPLIKVFLI